MHGVPTELHSDIDGGGIYDFDDFVTLLIGPQPIGSGRPNSVRAYMGSDPFFVFFWVSRGRQLGNERR